MKTQPSLQCEAEKGAAWCHTPGSPSIKEAMAAEDWCLTSTLGDAWLIGAWCQYWTGKAPIAIRSSRGYRMRIVDHTHRERVVTVIDPLNHRAGVQDIHTGAMVPA